MSINRKEMAHALKRVVDDEMRCGNFSALPAVREAAAAMSLSKGPIGVSALAKRAAGIIGERLADGDEIETTIVSITALAAMCAVWAGSGRNSEERPIIRQRASDFVRKEWDSGLDGTAEERVASLLAAVDEIGRRQVTMEEVLVGTINKKATTVRKKRPGRVVV